MTLLTALTWLTPLPGDVSKAIVRLDGRKHAALEALKKSLLHRAFAGGL